MSLSASPRCCSASRSACRWRCIATRRPALRNVLLGAASVVQTIPSLALLALFYPLLLGLAALCERLFGAGFSALGLPAVGAGADALFHAAGAAEHHHRIERRRSRHQRGRARRRHDAAAIARHGRTAAGAAGDHGRHPHRRDLGDRRGHAVDADRPDQPRQLHLHRAADAELGVRAVRLRRRGGVRAGRRSTAGADGSRADAPQARLGHGRRTGPCCC